MKLETIIFYKYLLQRFSRFSRKSQQISLKSPKIAAEIENLCFCISKFKFENATKKHESCWNFAIGEVQKGVNLIDLVRSFPTNVSLWKSVSIQLRTCSSTFVSFSSYGIWFSPTTVSSRARESGDDSANPPIPVKPAVWTAEPHPQNVVRGRREVQSPLCAARVTWVANKDLSWT